MIQHKLIKISLLSLLSYLLVCLLIPGLVRADAREDAFRAACTGTIQETNCSGTQLGALYIDLSRTLYCCDNNAGTDPDPDPPTSSDPRENAFLQKCYNDLDGDYTVKASVSLDSNPCNSGDNKLDSSSLGVQNIFCCQKNTTGDPGDPINIDPDVIDLKPEQLDDINPFKTQGSVLGDATPGEVINRSMSTVIFPLAGSILFVFIVWGGFQILSASLTGKQNYIDLGKQRITSVIVGFIILFTSYWLWRLVTLVLGLSVS